MTRIWTAEDVFGVYFFRKRPHHTLEYRGGPSLPWRRTFVYKSVKQMLRAEPRLIELTD